MTATGSVVQQSSRLFVAEAVLVDSEEREIGRGRGTFMRAALLWYPSGATLD